MAEEGLPGVHCNQFPTPPPFWRHFTPSNVARLQQIHASHDTTQDTGDFGGISQDLKPEDVPEGLRLLVPPHLPDSGQYESFGEKHKLSTSLPTLDEWNVEQLYPSQNTSPDSVPNERAQHFTRLVRSILLSFVQLTSTLSADPEQGVQKIEDLRVLFLNAHQLLNEYRPHQARETLVQRLQERVDSYKKDIENVEHMRTKVDSLLQSLGDVSNDQTDQLKDTASLLDRQKHGRRVEHARRKWHAMSLIEIG